MRPAKAEALVERPGVAALGLRALAANTLRSILTMLGIIIGVAR
jgi:hypothetical protein